MCTEREKQAFSEVRIRRVSNSPLPASPAVLAAAPPPIAPTPIPPRATEAQLIALWLHGKSANTG
jgi:hypothetical protein